MDCRRHKDIEKTIELLDTRYGIGFVAARRIVEAMSPVRFSRGQTIVSEGSACSDVYLLTEGIARCYNLSDGEQLTNYFGFAGDLLFSVHGYVAGERSRVSIEAESTCSMLRISRQALLSLFSESGEMAQAGRIIAERVLLDMEDHLFAFDKPTATERYLALLNRNPDVVRVVSLKNIASYLRIAPQSLSRIRKKLVAGR